MFPDMFTPDIITPDIITTGIFLLGHFTQLPGISEFEPMNLKEKLYMKNGTHSSVHS